MRKKYKKILRNKKVEERKGSIDVTQLYYFLLLYFNKIDVFLPS